MAAYLYSSEAQYCGDKEQLVLVDDPSLVQADGVPARSHREMGFAPLNPGDISVALI
jgi:hypothetical protein